MSISSAVPSKKRPQPEVVSLRDTKTLGRTLTADEQGITSKYSSVAAIFKKIADAVLRMARRMQCLHLDAVSNGECLAMARSFGDLVAVLTAYDRHGVGFELHIEGWLQVQIV